jgi:CHAT domain-containing protein
MKAKFPLLNRSLTFLLVFSLISISTISPNANDFAHPIGPIGFDSTEAASLLSKARSLMRQSNAEQALGMLEQALKLYTDANDVKGAAAAHDALGDLYSRQGQYDVALKQYKEAQQGFKSARDEYNANLMLAKSGDMQFNRGQMEESRYSYSQMDAKRPPNPDPLGQAQAAKSKMSTAKGIFGRMKGIATSQPSTSTASEVASTGAAAATEIQRARDTYRRFIIYSVYELGIGRVDFHNNQLDDAKQHFQNSLNASANNIPLIGNLGQTRRFRVAARTALGDVAFKRGNYTEAISLYKAAADGAKQDQRPDLAWPALRGIGRSQIAQAAQEKDQQRAAQLLDSGINSYREALKVIESIREGSINADDSRSTFLGTTKEVYDEASSSLAERALAAKKDGQLTGDALKDASDAFSIVEQSRARSLLDMLAETGTNLTEGVPADLVQKRKQNIDRQQEIAQILIGVGVAADTGTKTNEELETELGQLQTELDSIENQIRAASPKYAALTQPQPLSLAEVQQRVLDNKTSLLEYSLNNNASYLWAVTPTAVSIYKLPGRATIDQAAIDLRTELIPAKLRTPVAGINTGSSGQSQRGLGLGASGAPAEGVANFAKAANSLFKLVVEPAQSLIADRRVIVVADGALNYVPFEAMVTSTTGADYASLPYLVKTNEFGYAPSASVIGLLRQQRTRPTGHEVLVVADPVFSADDPRAQMGALPIGPLAETRGLGLASAVADLSGQEKMSASQNAAPQIIRLKGTRVEAEQIAQLAKAAGAQADTWLDFNASEGNVETRDVQKYRVVHFATHGLLDADHPQFSGLILSLVGNQNNDGFLRTDEIFNLRLGSPLVMLSACETGLGKEKRGEGVIGLTRAFMYAGAPTVGVSLWSVADRSTAELMADFYRNLLSKEGTSAIAAMRASQQKMIAGKKYSAPFYWAPFVIVGEWQ